MNAVPRESNLDSSHALLFTEGYDFISNRCRRFGTPLFVTRLMLQKVVCMQGAEAARQFYTPGRFTRRRAMPLTALTLIQDLGSALVLDDAAHRHRKALFLSLVTPEAVTWLCELTAAHWRAAADGWRRQGEVDIFEAAHLPLCAAVCRWSGLVLGPRSLRRRASELKAMIEGTGSVGVRNVYGHWKRWRSEHWARRVIRRFRRGVLSAPATLPAQAIAAYKDEQGKPLSVRHAAVELINVLRPTVAIARYLMFGLLALHEHPQWQSRLAASDADLDAFVDEVRRYYPFLPFVGGRVRQPFEWQGHRFGRGDWVLLDLYGTNRDPQDWADADVFRPERFLEAGVPDVVSHGAGDRRVTHRCPGEDLTRAIMKTVLRLMVKEISYEVVPGDHRLRMNRIPALPRQPLMLRNVRRYSI